MNLRGNGNGFTETLLEENVGGVKENSAMIDLDFDIGKLSVSFSPLPYQPSCVAADGSSVGMGESDDSGADILAALDSIYADECFEPGDSIAADINAEAFDPVSQPDFSRKQSDEGNDTSVSDSCGLVTMDEPSTQGGDEAEVLDDTSKSDSHGLVTIAEPSTQGVDEAEVLDDIEKACTQSNSLIVYTSSRRRSARNTKSSLNNESQKPSKSRRVASNKTVFDLSSLQVLRRSRSSFVKRARSSVWGNLVDILPVIEGNSGLDITLDKEKKLKRGRGGEGKGKAVRDQTGGKSTGKRCTQSGHISLKVRIGNKSCGIDNGVENVSVADIPDLSVTMANKSVEKVLGDVVSPCEMSLEKVMSSEASALSSQVGVGGTFYNQYTSSDSQEIRSLDKGENLGGLTEIRSSDVGTSPNSEVINSVHDGLPDLQDKPIVSKACVCTTDASNLILSPKNSKKGKKKDKLHQVDYCMLESMLIGADDRNDAKAPISTQNISGLGSPRTKSKKGKKKNKLRELGDSSVESNLISAETAKNTNAPADIGVGQKVGDVSYCSDASMTRKAKPYLNGTENKPSSGLVAASISSNLQVGDTLIPCSNGKKFPKCSRAKEKSKGRSKFFSREEDKASKKKGNKNNVDGKHLIDEKVAVSSEHKGVENLLQAGNQTPSDLGGTRALHNGLSGSINGLQLSSDGVREQYDPPRNAWVLCDECQKWRRIPAALADQIEETNCGWTCRDNTDKDFADCSIPQEKSNSEINEELEISDASCEEGAFGTFLKSNHDLSKAAQQSSWSLIKSNEFLHRNHKTQTIDEVMVCHCKLPSDGRMGCGAKCLNRMLNIECVHGTCPCGELCSNQQFQKRNYAKLKWFRCGRKGYGLQTLEDISRGQFLIEYVGEVLDVHAYEARQREYAMQDHKHFYFMTLNGSEVIDACTKGNLGRFINHSCDPNCRTEKWMINGEVCIGLFALRDIKQGEEITFDYNFVRVFGAAAKKCVCGSPNCRGYIGGDLTNSEVIAQDDSDDEFAEPVMICEDAEMNGDWKEIMSNTFNNGENEIAIELPQNVYSTKKLISAVGASIAEPHTSETSPQEIEGINSAQVVETRVGEEFDVYNSISNSSAAQVAEKLNSDQITDESLKGSMPEALKFEPEGLRSKVVPPSNLMDNSLQSDGILNKAVSSALEPVHSESPNESFSDKVEHKRKLKYATLERRDELAKSNFVTKTNRSSSSIKKGKPKMKILDKVSPTVDKLGSALHKSKKLPEHSVNSHVEAVEEKLNELLDSEGGISKRKDASRGYLKLLFLTAATGNNGHGEAIQSNRNLSMILDALLKTKSRTVLIDIINKNGLQMLHNIMKRCRKEFIKTPILRKLLKVLEYLATRAILTMEHITGGPPRPGVESFTDSMLTLTEHADKQVHQIARNFRDRWIPRSFRKNLCMEKDDGKTEFNKPSIHGGLSASYDYQIDKGVKPPEVLNTSAAENSTLDLSASGCSSGSQETITRKRKSRWDDPYPHSRNRTNSAGDAKIKVDEDVPPGFSSPCNGPMVPADASSIAIHQQEGEIRLKQHPCNSILGDPHVRFIARMPLSYGVPFSVMQKFGVHQVESSESLTVVPGVVFHPFPPLPPRALSEFDPSVSAAKCAPVRGEPAEMAGICTDTCVTYRTDQQHLKNCSIDPQEKNVSVANGRPDFQQGGSCNLGQKYFRQQKINNLKLPPPWVRMRNGRGFAGNISRNGLPGVVGLANSPNDFRNSYNSDDLYRGEF